MSGNVAKVKSFIPEPKNNHEEERLYFLIGQTADECPVHAIDIS